MLEDPIIYRDNKGDRVLDLRPDGVDCLPVLGMSSYRAIRSGPDYHIHPDCMEFCLCLKGNLIFDSEGGEYPFLPGHIFVSAPNEPHHLRHNPSGLKVYRILFAIPKPTHRLLGLDRAEGAWLSHALTHMPKRLFAATPTIRGAFERLFHLYDNETLGTAERRVRMKAAALTLLVALVEAAGQTPPKSARAIETLAQHILEHPDGDFPVADMAKTAGMSVSAFSDAFKRAKGLPLHAYVLNCRINRARALLEQTNRSIAAIAHELRFYSAQHFDKIFKRITGVSPTSYRQRQRGDSSQSRRKFCRT